MAEPIRLFILAGEPSGDRIGADLVKRLRVHHRATLTGVGGAELEGEGLKSLYPMSDLSVMGLTDVLKRLPLLLWRARQTSQAILAQSPEWREAQATVERERSAVTVEERRMFPDLTLRGEAGWNREHFSTRSRAARTRWRCACRRIRWRRHCSPHSMVAWQRLRPIVSDG